MNKKAPLLVVTALALAAPPVALGLRWRDGRAAEAHLARGEALLDAPLASRPTPESLDGEGAARAFEAARALDAGDVGRRAEGLRHVARAWAHLGRAEVVLAQAEAATATRMLPGDARATLASAVVALRRGEGARAERLFAAVERGDAPAAVRQRSGVHHVDVLLDAGRAHEALTLAEGLARAGADSAAVANRLGLARAAVGDVEGARAAWLRARSLDPRDVASTVNLARLARERGALDDARGLLADAVATQPESGEAWLAYGVVLSELGGERAGAAREALTRAATLRPDDAEPAAAQGMMALREGRLAAAAELFRAALERDAGHVGARTNLGVTLARMGDRAGATRAFQEVTERAPGAGAAWNGLGAMRLAAGDAARAVGALQQAAALLPDDPNPTLNLGLALVRLARWNDAAAAFRETLRRAPGNETALVHLEALQPDRAARQRVAAMRRPAGGA